MNFGFSTMFSYRPHVEHAYYLAKQVKTAGHDTFFLNCAGNLPSCYTTNLRQTNDKKIECVKCQIGSLKSYTLKNTTFLDSKIYSTLSEEQLKEMVISSSYTINRIEAPSEVHLAQVVQMQDSLIPSVSIVYENTKNWIRKNKLDYVIFFNGRMDITRAILQACKDENVKFSSFERTWFGDGIQLNPYGDCLSLDAPKDLITKYQSAPLTQHQVSTAASLITSRFRGETNLEWRSYNQNSSKAQWKTKDKNATKVLILPSSKNETMAHPDWENKWDEFPKIFEKVMNKVGATPKSTILRAHPNWGENIGSINGDRITKYYQDWCSKLGIKFIGPAEKASTSSLMAQADLVLLNGSSAVFEASLLLTPSISVAPSNFDLGRLSNLVLSDEELNNLDINSVFNFDKAELIRKTLRLVYTLGVRYALFQDSIKATKDLRSIFSDNFDTDRFINIIDTGILVPDDTEIATSTNAEDNVINIILKQDWEQLDYKLSIDPKKFKHISRRGLYKFVDMIRKHLKRGDA